MAVSSFVTLACLPDRIPSAAMTEGSEASADLASENVQSDILKKVWRAGYLTSRHSWLRAEWAGHQLQPALQAVQFTGNLSASGLYRVRIGSTTSPTDLWERLAPTARVSYSVATANDGVSAPLFSEVNEDCDTALASPDGGTRIDPAGAGPPAPNVVYSFATPATACITGSAVQEFRIVAGLQASGAGGNVTVKLYESGSAVASNSWFILSEDLSTTLKEFVFQWDAADLADSSGANVEVYISASLGSATVDVLIEAVEWNQYPTGDGGATYDTGVLPAFDTFASQQFGDADIENGFTGVNWWHGQVLTSEQASSKYLRLELWDRDLSSRKHSTYGTATIHDPLWSAVEVGRLLSGPIFVPTINAKAVDLSVDQYGKRVLEVDFQLLARSEILQNLYLWGSLNAGVAPTVIRTESGGTFVRDRGGPFCVVIPQANETGIQTLQNCYCRISSQPKYQDLGMISGASTMSVTLQLTEW